MIKMQDEVQTYEQLVNQTVPKPPIIKNSFFAFMFGGLISTIGQGITDLGLSYGLGTSEASAMTVTVLIGIAALLTGLGVWDNFAKVAGAGAIVPITGFANSMVASALEFKREGMVFGVGAKLFSIAGPVIVFGVVASWFVGLVAYILS